MKMKNKLSLEEKMEKLAELLYPYWKDIENPDEHIRKLRDEEYTECITITQTIDEIIQNEYMYDISDINTGGDNFAIGITAVKEIVQDAIKSTIEECGRSTEWYFRIYPNVLSELFKGIPTDKISKRIGIQSKD